MKNLFSFFIFIVVSAILHFVWESLHVRLYGGYENLSPYIPLSIWATLADILYAIGAVSVVSIIKQSFAWMRFPRINDLLGLSIIGLFISLFVEYKALAFEKWYYLDAMPIIPWLEVGLSPILQMTILLPVAAFIASHIINRASRQ